jgi:hypothetical protein
MNLGADANEAVAIKNALPQPFFAVGAVMEGRMNSSR